MTFNVMDMLQENKDNNNTSKLTDNEVGSRRSCDPFPENFAGILCERMHFFGALFGHEY